MITHRVSALTPFIPAKDFDLSLRFYRDLGFDEVAREPKMVRLGITSFGFWLQDYYVKEWAENCMLCLYVDNLEDWWSHISAMSLAVNYEGNARVTPPRLQDGANMLQLIDPAGVLWHLRQA